MSACVAGVAHLVITKDPTSPLPPPAIIPLGLATYSLPLATNVITTGLIVGKLRWMLHSTVLAGGRSTGMFQRGYGAVQRAAGIFIESGVLYLITQLILVVLFSIDHPANLIVSEIAVQVYVSTTAPDDTVACPDLELTSQGIASTLIIMRITLGIAHDSAVQRTPNVLSGSTFHSAGDSTLQAAGKAIPQVRIRSDAVMKADTDSIEMKPYLSSSRVDLEGAV